MEESLIGSDCLLFRAKRREPRGGEAAERRSERSENLLAERDKKKCHLDV